jgi:type II secretory pathway component PulF
MNLSELSLFYQNITELYGAGMNGAAIFETLMTSEKDTELRQKFRSIVLAIKKGKTLTEALRSSGLVPVNDLPMIHSGEKSGKLLQIFESLSKSYSSSAMAQKNILGGLVKPFFSLLIALFLPPLPDLILGKMKLATYLWHSLGIMAGVMLVFYFLYDMYMKSLFNIDLARTRHNIFSSLPFLSTLSKKMALEKFVSSLSLMLDSGIPIFEALELSGRSSPDTHIQSAATRVVGSLKAGRNLPQAFKPENVFTDDIKKSILIGNESGKLPEALQRSADRLKIEVDSLIKKISKTIPVMVYWLVSIYIAFIVISSNAAHMKELDQALKEINPDNI